MPVADGEEVGVGAVLAAAIVVVGGVNFLCSTELAWVLAPRASATSPPARGSCSWWNPRHRFSPLVILRVIASLWRGLEARTVTWIWGGAAARGRSWV